MICLLHLVESFPGVNIYNTIKIYRIMSLESDSWIEVMCRGIMWFTIIFVLRLLWREYQSFSFLFLSIFLSSPSFLLFEMCFFTEKNIYSFKQTVFQASIQVCYFDHGRHSGELVIGIQKESDYVTSRIHKPSIGPYYLPNQALIPQPAIHRRTQYKPTSLFRRK